MTCLGLNLNLNLNHKRFKVWLAHRLSTLQSTRTWRTTPGKMLLN